MESLMLWKRADEDRPIFLDDLGRLTNVTKTERHHMANTERGFSVLSIFGILFIMSTYLLRPGFNRPINRLVFFTSIGNFGMCLAALIAESGPLSGEKSSVCRFQAFMVQMFLGVDAYWSLCMAWNVYLVFFGRYTTKQLRGMDFGYLIICYGASFVPALTFLFINTAQRGPIYGDAVLWCWVSQRWAFLRLALVYSISWLAIVMAVIVYCRAGWAVWKRREELHGDFMSPFNEAPLKNTVTTEIQITSENRRASSSSGNVDSDSVHGSAYDPYSVSINVDPPGQKINFLEMRSLTRNAAAREDNTEALLYARAAFFYFIALLVVWLPSSINRAYAVAHKPDDINFGLNYVSSLLLSSQGLLNCIVYIITSRPAVVDLYRDLTTRAGRQKSRVAENMNNRPIPIPGKELYAGLSTRVERKKTQIAQTMNKVPHSGKGLRLDSISKPRRES